MNKCWQSWCTMMTFIVSIWLDWIIQYFFTSLLNRSVGLVSIFVSDIISFWCNLSSIQDLAHSKKIHKHIYFSSNVTRTHIFLYLLSVYKIFNCTYVGYRTYSPHMQLISDMSVIYFDTCIIYRGLQG